MAAFQFNTGRQAEELIEAGLLRDLTEHRHQGEVVGSDPPKSLLAAARSTARSTVWWSTSTPGSGCGCPTRPSPCRRAGAEELGRVVAAAPALEAKGIIPLAVGGQPWQTTGAFNVLIPAIAGKDVFLKVYQDKDATVAAGPRSQGLQGCRRRAPHV